MEDRLNEALDLIDDLTAQLDEATDEVNSLKENCKEMETLTLDQDKEILQLIQQLKTRDDYIDMLKKQLKAKDEEVAKAKENSSGSAELQYVVMRTCSQKL